MNIYYVSDFMNYDYKRVNAETPGEAMQIYFKNNGIKGTPEEATDRRTINRFSVSTEETKEFYRYNRKGYVMDFVAGKERKANANIKKNMGKLYKNT